MAKENLKPNEVKAPTLFIGVGGTGSKIVKLVAEMCHPEERENVNFVCLDTNVNDLSNVAGSHAHIYYVQTSSTQTVGDYLNYDHDALRNWFPKNAVIYDKTVSEGAGQVRAISRLALNASIKVGKIQPLYDAVDNLFRKDGKEMKQAMRVVIVSTASGGTGSGIMTPLAMFVRDYVQNKYPNTSLIVRSMVLLPETLDSVITSATERESQRRNAYATIKEINAFMMKGSGFFDVVEDLKRYRNLSIDFAVPGTNETKKLGLLPFDFCFLLDGQNAEDSTMINVGQYIKQAATALYQQNIGPMQKDAFSMEDNIIKEMSAPGKYGRNRFGGIGAGILRYPYKDIVKYVSYDWAKDAIGGEGQAAKWTKYDNEFEIKVREARKKGLPSSEWPTRGEVYVTSLNTSSDNFSKDLRTKYLNNINRKISAYFSNLSKAMHNSLSTNGAISGARNAANALANEIEYSDSANRGLATSNLGLLRGYESAVRINARKVAIAAAEGIFYNDTKTILEKRDYTLEMLIKNIQDEIAHPNAVRYLLYMVKGEMDKRIKNITSQINDVVLPALQSYSADADDVGTFNVDFNGKDKKEHNLDELCAVEKGEGKDPSLLERWGGYEKIYEILNSCFPNYYQSITDYGNCVAELEAYKIGAEYISEMSKAFEKFFSGFRGKVTGLLRKQDDLVDALRFQKGDSVRNICTDKELLAELSRSTMSAGAESSMLDSELNGKIFDAVKANVAFEREVRFSDVVEDDRRIDIFDEILLGYFEESVARNCSNLDLNVVEAIAMEKRLMARIKARSEQDGDEKVYDKVSPVDIENHVHKVLAMGRRLAAPGIQRLRSEESRELVLCAYNRSLDDMRNYRMDTLIPKGTSASSVDTVSRYEMHFFNALYNLTADKLDKFASPCASETTVKNAGLYHNAYVNYSRDIGPDSTKGSIISTHIDKRWDSLAVMPELDLNFQERQISRIHQALVYALIYNAISRRKLSNSEGNRYVYKYENSDERYVDLTVSNGTLCDEFYEILDALYVSSSIVMDVDLVRQKRSFRDLNRSCDYDETIFAKAVKNFRINGQHESATSLFEIPLVYFNSLPNSKRYTSELTSLVDAVIKTMADEIALRESTIDARFILCRNLEEQFNLLMDNYEAIPELNAGVDTADNMLLDIIFRRVRRVIEDRPEPANYEETVNNMRSRIYK